MRAPGRGTRWLAGYYFLYFATVGITLPFLPAYFISLGLSATQSGVLLALSPLLGLVGPPLFGRWADQSERRERILVIVTLGSILGLAPLAAAGSFAGLAAAMTVYAFFNTAIVPLVDALTLDRVAASGGSYAHVRLFGSVGFIVAAAAFGLGATHVGRATVLAPVALLAVGAVVALWIRPPPRSTGSAGPRAWSAERELWLLLAATCLHWIASAPYNGTFILYVHALGLPNGVVGVSAALGVAAEVCAMALYPRLSARARPKVLLAIAFLGSAVRWAGMAVATHAATIVALNLLHGLTFGLFYVAAVDAVARRVPPEHRAGGLALFVAVTFGLGGLVGYLAAGAGFDWLGGSWLFALAAVTEAVACALLLAVRPAPQQPVPARSP